MLTPEDSCHYPETAKLEEYVLNNKGRIWVGSAGSNYGRPWQFAQFKRESLEVSLWLLNNLYYNDRGDPIKVTKDGEGFMLLKFTFNCPESIIGYLCYSPLQFNSL